MSDRPGGSSSADDPFEALLAAGVEAEIFPGAVAAVGSAESIDRLVAVGEADPERDRFGVLLTNEVYHGKDGGMADVREKFRDVIARER